MCFGKPTCKSPLGLYPSVDVQNLKNIRYWRSLYTYLFTVTTFSLHSWWQIYYYWWWPKPHDLLARSSHFRSSLRHQSTNWMVRLVLIVATAALTSFGTTSPDSSARSPHNPWSPVCTLYPKVPKWVTAIYSEPTVPTEPLMDYSNSSSGRNNLLDKWKRPSQPYVCSDMTICLHRHLSTTNIQSACWSKCGQVSSVHHAAGHVLPRLLIRNLDLLHR